MVGSRGALTNTNTATSVTAPNSSALDDQTKAFIQQLIDSAMTGIQASFQESLRQVVLQQDYLKADVQQVKNGECTSNGGNKLQFGRITKLEFPKFTGVDVKNWLYKSQQFFSVEHADDADKEDYQKALLVRFDIDFEDPLSELKNLKCDSTVQKYHEKFELLLNKVDMPEAHAISLFLGRMPQSISLLVRMFKPKSLSDTASLCKLQEAAIAAQKARQSPILPKPNTRYGSFGNRGGYVAPRNQATPLALPAPKKFVPGHKCSGQAFALESVIDPEPQMEMYVMEGIEEEFVMPEVTNEEIPQISFNALTGLTSYRTMRVIGHFGRQRIHILIDSGSTHNFLDVYMAKNLSFQHEGRYVAFRGTTKSHVQWFSGKQLTKHVTQKADNLSSMSLCVPDTSVMSLDVTHKPVFGVTFFGRKKEIY
nr:hypothetical protein [Tanacetum cinerariifolium]